MRKLGILISNEILKITKKTAVMVLFIVMTVGMIGCSVVFKVAEEATVFIEDFVIEEDKEIYENNLESIKQIEAEIEKVEKDSKEYINLLDELYWLKSDCVDYEVYTLLAEKYNIADYSYKYEILDELYETFYALIDYEYMKDEYSENTSKEELQATADKYMNMLESCTYEEYINLKKDEIKQDTAMFEAEKERQTEYYDLLLKICPTGEYESYEAKYLAEELIASKVEKEQTLESGIDYNKGCNLTEEEREKAEKDLAIINKKIECSILDENTSESIAGMGFFTSLSIGNLFIAIILIILAGSMISHETSTGTIKSLIIAPVSRWKIYLAKYVTLILTALVLTVFSYIVSILVNGILYGFDEFGTEVYYVFDNVIAMNFATSQFISALCSIIPVMFFATMAFMLSSITKSTAASVAVSLGVYWGGELLQMILVRALGAYPYITKFLPFGNIQWFDKILYAGNNAVLGISSLVGAATSELGNTSAIFAILYTLILVACMYFIGRDSFCRKDIK